MLFDSSVFGPIAVQGEDPPKNEGGFFDSSAPDRFSTEKETPAPQGGFLAPFAEGEDAGQQVEINGDQVEYSMAENKVIASGNVSIVRKDVTLLCDRLEFDRAKQLALAEGHVVLIRNEGRMTGEKMRFDFGSMTGEFLDASFASQPLYGRGEKMLKVGENHLRMDRGYMTTCDLDKPHFRFAARKADIYPGDKAVARHVRLMAGRMPLVYIPRFTQNISNKRPIVSYTPGYDKHWGPFLLTTWRYRIHENLKTTVHFDYRQRKDLAWGVDLDYKIPNYGGGILKTYYMNERDVKASHFFKERLDPTTERQRYRIDWRHKWDVDPATQAVWQYHKMTDVNFLKDYFEREADKNENPESFFLMTRALPTWTFSYLTSFRANRFNSAVEKLPELRSDLTSTELGTTGFYLKNTTTYSNLTEALASPSDRRKKTQRVDTDSELAYPFKLSFFELRPFAGGEHTYYSRTADPGEDDLVRGLFRTGGSVSTKFYRIFDIYTDKWGLDINRLRHIATPSVKHEYIHDPTIFSDKLQSYDAIDSRERKHALLFSLEHKLQTKRDMQSIDLVRFTTESDFHLKEHPGKPGFQTVRSDVEIRPLDWLSFYSKYAYNTKTRRVTEASFDFYINGDSDPWYYKFSKRWKGRLDDTITSEWGYKINQKWSLRIFEELDLDRGRLREQEYNLRRDLHCWYVDFNWNKTVNQGDELWMIFTMKAFPEIGIDVDSSFNRRKPGSQYRPGEELEDSSAF